jgi:hypothetical protein
VSSELGASVIHQQERQRWLTEQEQWHAEQQRQFEAAQTAQAREYESNLPYYPGAPPQHPDIIQPRRQPFTFGEVIREGQREANTSVYRSPPRTNEGHAAKKKSGLDMTPNSSRLNSSLKELSIEKERAEEQASQHTAATKKKLFARPAELVPPQQTVKGTLPQHQRIMDQAQNPPGR